MFPPALERRLRGQSVQMDAPDANTLILKDVPVDPRAFSKPRTNVLLKRPNPGMPFLVGIDEDLNYIGGDPALVRAFTAGPKRDGWRIVPMISLDRDLPQAVDRTLTLLGSAVPPATDATPPELLDSFGINLTAALDAGRGELCCGRDDELDTVLSTLLSHGQVRLPVIAGRSGSGKSNLLWAVARRLQTLRPDWHVMAVDLPSLWTGTMFDAERERLLATILDDARRMPGTVVAIEMLGLASFSHCGLLLSKALDNGLRAIGTTLLESVTRFRAAPLSRRTVMVPLAELGLDATLAALESAVPPISETHGVAITPSLLTACVKLSRPLPGYFPAKALALLDAAASRAALSGNDALSLDDLSTAARSFARQKRGDRGT